MQASHSGRCRSVVVAQNLSAPCPALSLASSGFDADLRRLCEPKMLRLLQSLWRLATIGEHGAHVEETTAIFLLSKPRAGSAGAV